MDEGDEAWPATEKQRAEREAARENAGGSGGVMKRRPPRSDVVE